MYDDASLSSMAAVHKLADPLSEALGASARRFVLHWGEMGWRWGVNRTVSQIHALLFLLGRPMHAEEIAELLQVARSNVSNSLRELQNWTMEIPESKARPLEQGEYFLHDLIGLTRYMNSTQKGVKADAFRSLLGEAHRYPQLLERFKSQVFDPLFQVLTDLLHDASRRGEIPPARLTPVVLEVLHALIIKRMLLETRNLTEKDITEMIDEVLLPLVVAKPDQGRDRKVAR